MLDQAEPTNSDRWNLLAGARRLTGVLASHLLQEVPSAIAACEFDCRVADCTPERMAGCPGRLARMVAIDAKAGAPGEETA